MTELNAERARRAIVDHTRRLAESAAAAGSDAAMPTTPGWTITDLAGHVGQTQNWVAMLTSPAWEMQRPASAHAIRGTGQTLQWLATDIADGAGAWFIERRPDGATWQPGNRPADVTVKGPAQSLLLTMTRRLPLTGREAAGISVDGDTGLAQHWLDSTAHVSG